MRRFFSPLQVVGAYREYYRVFLLYFCVVVCQLDELRAAERSPECAVEDEHDIAVSPICAQGIVVPARAWQREVWR